MKCPKCGTKSVCKKLSIFSVVLCFIIAFSGCGDGGTYKKASDALANGDYTQAIELLDSIPDYDDVDELRKQAKDAILQQTAGEYFLEVIENGGYHVPTSIIVLKAGYNSAVNGDEYANIFGCEGIFYFTIQAQTKGGGNATGDVIILYGGDRDKEIMTNENPGNDYPSYESSLDVKALNIFVKQHWVDLGVMDATSDSVS